MKKLKYIILVISGLSDVPSEQLEGQTPLERAHVPNMDSISTQGRIGWVETLSEDLGGGSDKALLSLLGYDLRQFSINRGALEAAGIGLELGEQDLALRLNFVSTLNGMLVDHNAGQISDAEAASLIKMLNARFGDGRSQFYSGVGYRNLLVLKDGRSLDFKTVPPHEALHQPLIDFYPYGRDASLIIDLMEKVHHELLDHDINRVRIDLGENPANQIWLWGEGVDFKLPYFETFFPLKGCIISAVPLLKGIARKIGFHHLAVPGATGYVNTDYLAKARCALKALSDFDLTIIHISAVNEVCHQGDLMAKVHIIEEIDRKLLNPLMNGLEQRTDWRLMITTDHITPVEESLPLKWPVPVAFCGHEVTAVREYPFNEKNAQKSDLFIEKGQELMEFFLGIPRS